MPKDTIQDYLFVTIQLFKVYSQFGMSIQEEQTITSKNIFCSKVKKCLNIPFDFDAGFC
jgi:hypothetical protein